MNESPKDSPVENAALAPVEDPAVGVASNAVATTDVALRTEDVWKIYPQEPEDVEAVRGVSLEVRAGDFMTMAGPSGSGKTTLLGINFEVQHGLGC